MDSRKLVFKETAIVLIGQTVCVGVMLGVFALLGQFNIAVLLGGIFGVILAAGNFFFMATTASLAADKAVDQDVEGGQKLMKASYPVRILVLAVILIALSKSGICNVVALVLPLVFVRPVLTVAEFFRKKGA